jgi:APA family basic amino acid/polyamine antiporter
VAEEESALRRWAARKLDRWSVAKSIEQAKDEAEASDLERTLDAKDLTLLGVGAMVGAGIFTIIGTVSALYAGPSVALAFAVAALASGLTALCYAELVTVVPVSGSAYSYTYATLGELVAWLVGWNLILAYLIGNTAVAVAWSSNFGNNLLPLVGLSLPEVLQPLPDGGSFDLMAVVVMVLITAILVLGIEESTTMNNLLVGFLVLVLGAFIAVGAFNIDPANWTPVAPFGWEEALVTAPALVFFAFIGFDAVSTAVEETKDPQVNAPRGILGSLVVTALLYVAVSIVLTGMVSYTQLNVGDPLAQAFDLIGLTEFGTFVALGGVAATTSTLLVFQLAAIRVIMTMSRDGLLPGLFSQISPRFRTPALLTVIAGTVVAAGAATVPLDFLVEFVNVGTFAVFALVVGALIYRRQVHPEWEADFELPGYPFVPLAALGMILFMMASLPTRALLGFGIWMGVGLILYAVYGYANSELWEPEDDAEPVDG